MASRRMFAVLAALAVPLVAAAPASALQPVGTPTKLTPPFLSVADRAGDLQHLGGTKDDVAGASGLDVLAVRHRVRNDGRLVIVSKHRNLTPANTVTNPDAVAVGEAMTMIVAYVDPTPRDMNDTAYAMSFDKSRKLSITDPTRPGALIPCPDAAKRSRIDLKLDVVRYVVPTACLADIEETRTIAQIIRYKVTERAADGVETIEMVTLDQNRPAPRVALR